MKSVFILLVCASLYISCYCNGLEISSDVQLRCHLEEKGQAGILASKKLGVLKRAKQYFNSRQRLLLYKAQVWLDFITPCSQQDRACLLSTAQKAVPAVAAGRPEFGMKSLDPLHVGRVVAHQGGLIMEFDDTIVKGLRKCQVLDMTRHGDQLVLKVKCSVVLSGNYRLDGQLLVMPINGNGKYKIKIEDIVVEFSLNMGRERSGGEEYWHFNSWDFKDHVETRVRFLFHDLFSGKKELADAMHAFANDHWQEIYKELSAPIVRQVMKEIVHEMRKFFKHVPIRQLALD